MSYEDEEMEYDEEDIFQDYGEGIDTDFDALSEKKYEAAFDKALKADEEIKEFLEEEQEVNEEDYEYDSVVGGRDKKPIMSLLNKGKLSKYEMDDLLNGL